MTRRSELVAMQSAAREREAMLDAIALELARQRADVDRATLDNRQELLRIDVLLREVKAQALETERLVSHFDAHAFSANVHERRAS